MNQDRNAHGATDPKHRALTNADGVRAALTAHRPTACSVCWLHTATLGLLLSLIAMTLFGKALTIDQVRRAWAKERLIS